MANRRADAKALSSEVESSLWQTFLHYYHTLDPSTGQYPEPDLIGLYGGLNSYGHVGGNPLNFVDPLIG